MSRDLDPRPHEPERPSPNRGSRGGGNDAADRSSEDPREVFTRDLDLPRGAARVRVWTRNTALDLAGSEVRTLATVGAFRVVPTRDLREASADGRDGVTRDVRHLRDAGLVGTMPYVVGRTRTTLVTLTDHGRALLEDARRSGREPAQVFYAGIVKPRELAHDARLYDAYLRSADRLTGRGARIRRVVLDYELKRDYQRFLQEHNRGRRDSSGRSDRHADEVARWAHDHHLTVLDGHVQFPDVRIEYDERDGRGGVEDVEVMTPHYRGAQRAAKGQAGFTCYRAAGARVGGGTRSGRGGRAFDPRVAEEVLR